MQNAESFYYLGNQVMYEFNCSEKEKEKKILNCDQNGFLHNVGTGIQNN